MIKKLLLVPLMGIISFGAFASADSITVSSVSDFNCSPNSFYILPDGFNCSSSYCSFSFIAYSSDPGHLNFNGKRVNIPPSSAPEDQKHLSLTLCSSRGPVNCDNFDSTSPLLVSLTDCRFIDDNIFISSDYISLTPPVPETPETPDDGDSSYIPSIPDTFTSGLTNLLNNFGSTIIDWLPTIILVSLGIYAIFALFRVVRNYSRSSFNG